MLKGDGSPDGLMNLSYLGGFRVNPWPTNVTLVTIRFQLFFFLLPDFRTLNISSSATGRTCSHKTVQIAECKASRIKHSN